jgi:uncharacterized protein YdeI (YjbR/CyaY-like superfamily)
VSRPTSFATPVALRRWLSAHHSDTSELWVLFQRKESGKPSLTWPESVDEALSFGWIDGIRKRVDETSYLIRFTPRKPGSIWSAVNIRRAQALIRLGRMRRSGREAFAARTRSRVYSYEQRKDAALAAAEERRFRGDERAWTYFRNSPPSYRRTAIFWVVSAKKPETRRRRLDALIDDSSHQRRIGPLRRTTR